MCAPRAAHLAARPVRARPDVLRPRHPGRGAFPVTGDEGFITDGTYVWRAVASERAWAQLVTWRQRVSLSQGQALQGSIQDFGYGRERGAGS